jgi:hypothetical protein
MKKSITLLIFISMLSCLIAQNKPNFDVSGFIYIYELIDSCEINYEFYNNRFLIINRDEILNDTKFSSGNINVFFKTSKIKKQFRINTYSKKNIESKVYIYEPAKKEFIIKCLNVWKNKVVEDAKTSNNLDMFIFQENKPYKEGIKIIFKRVYKEVDQKIIKHLKPKDDIIGGLHINYTVELTVLYNGNFKYRFYNFNIDRYRFEKYLLNYTKIKPKQRIIRNVKSDTDDILDVLVGHLERVKNHYTIIKTNEDNFDIIEMKLLKIKNKH